jgi:hypothetical protein
MWSTQLNQDRKKCCSSNIYDYGPSLILSEFNVSGFKEITKWTLIRENGTHSYNKVRHSTTGITPFNLIDGLAIRKMMNKERLESVLCDLEKTYRALSLPCDSSNKA